MREGSRLRVFENRVLRRTYERKRDEATGEWRKPNEELNDLYCSQNIIRVIKSSSMRWAWQVARLGERRDVYLVLVGKPEGRRPLEKSCGRWEENIKMELQEVGLWCMYWIEIAQERETASSCKRSGEPSGSIKF
jgi:hypothetical protein